MEKTMNGLYIYEFLFYFLRTLIKFFISIFNSHGDNEFILLYILKEEEC